MIWLTGLPCAGKSTLAVELETRLSPSIRVARLDGDEIRRGLCSDLGFSREDRAENVRRVAEVAAILARPGLVTIVALVSPFAADRALARAIAGRGGAWFLEVFVDAPLTSCEARDARGMYRRARRHELPHFTGVSAPYEPPERPDVHVRTDRQSPAECAALVIDAATTLDTDHQPPTRATAD